MPGRDFGKRDQRAGMSSRVQVPGLAAFTLVGNPLHHVTSTPAEFGCLFVPPLSWLPLFFGAAYSSGRESKHETSFCFPGHTSPQSATIPA